MLVVALTNQVTKNGLLFPTSVLEVAYRQSYEYGVMPSFISHDFCRPYGVTFAVGMLVNPVDIKLIFDVREYPDENFSLFEEIKNSHFNKTIFNVPEKSKSKLINFAKDKFSKEDAFFITGECDRIVQPNIAAELFPSFFTGADEDKTALVNSKNLHPIAPGLYKVGEYVLFAHKFFRRNCSQFNNLNLEFLSLFQNYFNNDGLEVQIRLDRDSIGIFRESILTPLELEYWWGPSFSNDLPEIKNGITKHGAPKNLMFFHGIHSTDFFWHEQNGIKTFECEELRDTESLGISNHEYACRYVHSIAVLNKDEFCHLDGAVRLYDEEKYIERIDCNDMSKAEKNAKYIKLWRIDPAENSKETLKLQDWKNLICHYYRDNHLPGEYLGGADPKRDVIKKNDANQSSHTQNPHIFLLPTNMTVQDGVMLLISYRKKPEVRDESVKTIPIDYLSDKNNNCWGVIELSALDLIKILRNTYDDFEFYPERYKYNAIEDMDISYPLIAFSGNDAVNNANKLTGILISLFSHLQETYPDRFIALNISILYQDQNILFAFSGHIVNLLILFKEEFHFPEKSEDLADWMEQHIQKKLAVHFKDANISIDNEPSIQASGELYFNRQLLPKEYYQFHSSEDGFYKIQLSKELEPLTDLIERKEIFLVPDSIVSELHCMNCGSDYLICNCINSIIEGKGISVNKIEDMNISIGRNSAFS